ncbi:MAG: hypothetical protein LBE09_06930, partial [Christensenellaceae bacterium]|nr:hypothetical protein [Christensenellaceae bacterium]
MLVDLYPSYMMGTVDMIPSKSYLHRILISGTLSNSATLVLGKSQCDDVGATIMCLKQMGARIKEVNQGYI